MAALASGAYGPAGVKAAELAKTRQAAAQEARQARFEAIEREVDQLGPPTDADREFLRRGLMAFAGEARSDFQAMYSSARPASRGKPSREQTRAHLASGDYGALGLQAAARMREGHD
jgi:hypothetical protein